VTGAPDKTAARAAALARRKAAHEAGGSGRAGRLSEVLAGHRGVPLSGYLAMRTEIDPLPAMEEAAAWGPVGVPVIPGPALPLKFREWSPGCAMETGTFGARIPSSGAWMVPQIVIVPLLAFDRRGGRLGYGGGYYDRTLELLRRDGPVLAIGFAYAAQEADHVPMEPTDQPLDLIVTERAVIEPGRG
jgi:5-formyltetrahydrofolate cyclo-ligase